MVKLSKTQTHRPDFILLVAVLALVLFGLLMIYNASPVTSLRDFGNPLYLIRLQAIWVAVGIVLGLVVFKIPYTLWQKTAPFLMLFALTLLIAVFIPGLGAKIYGAQRWLRLWFVGIQPAEFAKLAYIIYLSALLTRKIRFIPFLLITAGIVAIVLAQMDLGTSIIITLIGLTLYFLASGALWHIVVLAPCLVVLAGVFILTSGYRKARLLTFLNLSIDPQGISYHVNQVLIALGSGGLLGVGLGESRQKYGYIPEVTTDSIFAVIGNELGFVGSTVFIAVFILIIYRGFKIASLAPDKFGQLVAAGITTWICLQTFINIAGLVALLPLTGVPLPFTSYGGSSLVATLLSAALLLNISKHTKVSGGVVRK
ncbi:MAG: cell division protein FtsW [Candidatus Woykebacteria bacterium GWB1_45_5]|uniref:Probable peptidoglycan glycosyltransferase FtsW n=2 Tax=Candidatus Woykeibacteriota TaxID=1817899 RepID=A0A1G1W1T7_9BACT|nr:MAG: cell division protein FtsW [Candidatus Woykebacteria bacterium GWA1_44_8]OGY23064.1 MAG: cell division protein FtsW [Candidatus Woykebacteria bacterium GWB1_45_5]